MNIRKNIQYIILEKNQTTVKFYNEINTKIYLKSVLKKKIGDHLGNSFQLIKSNDVTVEDFNNFLDSLNKYCAVEDRRGNRVTLKVNNPF